MRQLNENFSTLYLKKKNIFYPVKKLAGRGTHHPPSLRAAVDNLLVRLRKLGIASSGHCLALHYCDNLNINLSDTCKL